MKAQKLECLLGGAFAQNLSLDTMLGLNRLAKRLSCDGSPTDELFDVAVRHADEQQLRQLARLRMDSERSAYLD